MRTFSLRSSVVGDPGVVSGVLCNVYDQQALFLCRKAPRGCEVGSQIA